MRSLARFVAVLSVLAGCGNPPANPPTAEDREPAVATASLDEHEGEAEAPPTGEPTPHIEIPAGTLRVGSVPGTPSRRPSVEADLVAVEVPAFAIDRLPYPNDPETPAKLVSSRAEAAALCEARGQRLCHELEWERACKGDESATYPTGEELDLERCAETPEACASPLGVFSMGLRAAEWTASDAEPRLARAERTAVAKGGSSSEPLHLHRCAARRAARPEGGEALAFRCCSGPWPELAYPDVGAHRMFQDLELERDALRAALKSIPELASYADDFQPYGKEEALRAIARGGATEADMHWEIAPGPFAWSPSPGELVWVIAGASGDSSLLAALYPLPDGTFRHAASFIFAGERIPLAVLRTRTSRDELLWTACWSCAGESGAIRFNDLARIVIAQQ